jgi:hypothetical protein
MRTPEAFGLALVFAVLAANCRSKHGITSGGSAAGSAGKASSTGGNSSDRTSSGGARQGGSSAGVNTADRTGSGGSGGVTSRTSESRVCTSTECAADFLCYQTDLRKPKCRRGLPWSLHVGHDVPCKDVCGTPCCIGGTCRYADEDCPKGQGCAYPTFGSWDIYTEAKCVPAYEYCGGVENKACPDGKYCEHAGAFCDGNDCPYKPDPCEYARGGGLGYCRPLPEDSACGPEAPPVCGCDGVTYANRCALMKASAAFASNGACPNAVGAENSWDGGRGE